MLSASDGLILLAPCCECSLDFPFSLEKFIPFYVGAEYHNYHHYAGGKTRTNFSSVFTYCDYIYGTNKVSLVNHCYIYTQNS